MGAVMLSVRRSKHTQHFSIASVAVIAQGFPLPPQTPTASPVDWSEGFQCWGVFRGATFRAVPGAGAPGSLEFRLLVSLGALTPLCRCASRNRKRTAVGTLVLGITCTVLLVLSWYRLLLVPVVFCSITDPTVAALALSLGIRTCACLRFKPLAQSSHFGEGLNVAGAGRAPAKSGGGPGCWNAGIVFRAWAGPGWSTASCFFGWGTARGQAGTSAEFSVAGELIKYISAERRGRDGTLAAINELRGNTNKFRTSIFDDEVGTDLGSLAN